MDTFLLGETYFHMTPDDAFGDNCSYIDEFQKQTNCYYDYKYEPKEGAMIIFPAHLIHKVEENKSNEDRISVSFNIDLLNFLE